ncbi:hypothetical protein ACFQ7F_11625 [Streptomyces sp. NPDC056486]|uniref:hypothetical protein n=1 Tax=Streptomyces sp. NPDC056486 TaxID=3345835 RepID=UPI0036CD36D8
MAGSAKPARRKAARAAIGGGGAWQGRRPREPKRQGPQEGRWGKAGFACLVLLVAIAAGGSLVLGPYAWAGEMWRDLAPVWPGEGYGFAVTAGLLLPVAGALALLPLGRTDWKQQKARSAAWTAAALPGIGACVLILSIAMHTIRPKRSHRNGYCSDSGGEYCWVSLNYPYVWLVGLGATVLGAVAIGRLYGAYRTRRKA